MDFGSAFVNVLAIIAIIAVAGFVIVFISDLLLNILDGKSGIFFKKEKKDDNNVTDERKYDDEHPLENNNELDSFKVQEMFKNKFNPEANTATSEDVTNNEYSNFEDKINDNDIFNDNNDPFSLRENNPNRVNYDLAEKEEQEIKNKLVNRSVESKINPVTIYLQIDEIATAILDERVKDETNIDRISKAADELDKFDIESLDFDKLFADEKDDEDAVSVEVAEDEEEDADFELIAPKEVIASEPEIKEKIVYIENNEEKERLEKENKEMEEKLLKLEILLAEHKNKTEEIIESIEEKANFTTVEECKERIDELESRLKEAKKSQKINDKEYKPLVRVRKNLEKYKKKLRRIEIIVTNKKLSLYGVNNYVDIDKEKTQELMNDIELYDGLRLSVQDCENVIENNKDRYPILVNTNNIITANIAAINRDLELAYKALGEFENN